MVVFPEPSGPKSSREAGFLEAMILEMNPSLLILDKLNLEESTLPLESNSTGFLIEEERKPKKVSFGWVKLIARIYEVLPLVCPKCGETMRIIAFIEDRPTIEFPIIPLNRPTC